MIYEINTAVWLADLSRAAGRRLTLADVGEPAWDAVTPAGIDAVWLMGVWERSPAGVALARANPQLMASFRAALPDLEDQDIIGSPYCVRNYVVAEAFGGRQGLAAARAALAARGVRLILDYVPNHVAPDHWWVAGEPELFIVGDKHDLRTDPAGWLRADGRVLAHGRDPYFPPWPDVVQLNAFSLALRAATVRTLADIANQCDGIRCDMAMLVTNEVFGRTWGSRAGPEPAQEFWPAVLGELRIRHPETVLIAEVYWDMERVLTEQGFDYCYDKRLYDRLASPDAPALRDHLRGHPGHELLRFCENHDEPRIAGLMPPDAERAVAVTIATLPGAPLWHEGQFEGRRVRPPVFLGRRPDEPADEDLARWYLSLLAAGARVRRGGWRLLEATGWPANQSCRHLIAWSWGDADGDDRHGDDDRHVIVINLSGSPAQGRIPLAWTDLPGRSWSLAEVLEDRAYQRDGAELTNPGLFVSLAPWQFHLLRLTHQSRVSRSH